MALTEEAFEVVVVGSASFDYLARGRTLPGPGSIVKGRAFHEAPGGKGANQAIAASRLGAKTAFCGRVGRDWRGEAILDALTQSMVDVSSVTLDETHSTGVAVTMVDDAGEKQTLTSPGANERLSESDVAEHMDLIGHARVLVLDLGIPMEVVAAAVRLASRSGAQVVLDPSPPALLTEELLRGIHVLRLDALEAEVLTGLHVDEPTAAARAAKQLLRRGAAAVCIGVPPGGNLLMSSQGELWLPHIPVRSVDRSGAGDAFAGGLAAALAQGQTLEQAARFGHAAAAQATTKLGAQAGLPNRAEVQALLG